MNIVLALLKSIAFVFIMVFAVLYIPSFESMLFNYGSFVNSNPNTVVLLQLAAVAMTMYFAFKPVIMLLREIAGET